MMISMDTYQNGENLLHMAVGVNSSPLLSFLLSVCDFDLNAAPATMSEWTDCGTPVHLAALKVCELMPFCIQDFPFVIHYSNAIFN